MQEESSQPATTTDETAGWKTYTDTNYGFSFKYPTDWFIKKNNDGIGVFFSKSPTTPLTKLFAAFYIIDLNLAKEGATKPLYVTPQEYFDYYSARTSAQAIQIGNMPAVHRIATGDDRYFIYTKDREISFVLYPGDAINKTEYQPSDNATMEKVISTLSFTDPSKSFVKINIVDSSNIRIDSISPSSSAADGSIITIRGAGFNSGLPGSNDTVVFRGSSQELIYIPDTVSSDGTTLTFKLTSTSIAGGIYQVSVGVARPSQDRPGSVTVKSNSVPFTVTSKGITLLSPNGGEVFKAGNPIPVQWKSSQNDSFFVSLLGDPTQGYCLGPNFTQALAGDESETTFTISPATILRLTEGNTCRFKIKITSNTNASISDISDDYFTVIP
ncbi:MAG: PsbP-related protein [Patescibacteria group bacterium]